MWMLSGIHLVCLLWLELPPLTVKLGCYFPTGMSRVSFGDFVLWKGERPSVGSVWKADILFKNETVVAWQHQGSLWVFSFYSWCLMSTGAFLKETLNILMIIVSFVHLFLKDVRHCTVIFKDDIAFVFHWKAWIDFGGAVSCGLYTSIAAPTINSKRSNWGRKWFSVLKEAPLSLSPKHWWRDRKKCIARMLLR